MSWKDGGAKQKGESESAFEHALTWGVIGGLLVKIRSMWKGSNKKQKLPREGTDEYMKLVREGEQLVRLFVISAFIGMVITVIQWIRNLK
jgi:hypothetical protein